MISRIFFDGWKQFLEIGKKSVDVLGRCRKQRNMAGEWQRLGDGKGISVPSVDDSCSHKLDSCHAVFSIAYMYCWHGFQDAIHGRQYQVRLTRTASVNKLWLDGR